MWWRKRRLERLANRTVVASPRLFELDDDRDLTDRIDLARFLIVEQAWPASAYTVHALRYFADAVKRRYVAVRGDEPPRDGLGPVYRGVADYLIVCDVFDEEMPAIEERLAFEGRGLR